ncbi:hypothetical protein BVRB_9g224590 [Beta vulgaris subsp. vulgaris]|uniref:Uncharacterized protein n=1 Tax=Beta vulgaris subsp. vulgaris TaxID=3555 RepID=A0A0J8B637_BETVV|nr:hypothetical protein BVRB_9g224590 [Beta vulgaris subsp. vulgaris]
MLYLFALLSLEEPVAAGCLMSRKLLSCAMRIWGINDGFSLKGDCFSYSM